MDRKINIGVVAGELTQYRQLALLDHLHGKYDIELYAIDNDKLLSSYKSSLRLNVFENLRDMPGYMRTLEERLSEKDLLICLETSYLSSFQTIRMAKKTGKPCIVIVNEFHPYFYVNYPNIRAIQVDVLEHADMFWPTSRLAQAMLRMEGVAPEKIVAFNPTVEERRIGKNAALKKRFRDYIKLNDDHIVCLFNEELDPSTRPMELVNAMRLLQATDPKTAAKVRILFVGNGEQTQELKYRCYDLKLGSAIMFLHQETEPFVRDMYAAADLIISLRKDKKGRHETYPMHVLEAMAAGVVPIVAAGTVAAELAAGVGEVLTDDTFQSLAMAISKFAKNPPFLAEEAGRCVQRVRDSFSRAGVMENLELAIDTLLVRSENAIAGRSDFDAGSGEIEGFLARGQNADALVKIEGMLLQSDGSNRQRSDLLLSKGDALYGMGRLDEGMEAYTECLRMDDSNYRAYSGLGYIAFKGHSHEDAMTFFKKALAKNDRDEKSLLGVGLIHRRLGLHEESLFWLEKCVSLNKENGKAMTALIQACLQCSSPATPIATLQRVMEGGTEHVALMLTLGQLYLRAGQIEEGNELVKKALQLQQGSAPTPAAS